MVSQPVGLLARPVLPRVRAGHRVAALLRRALWRSAFTLGGHGVRVTGTPPRGGCVVVANHSSHADTAALLAALRARTAPVVAAAADHWFSVPWRAGVCRALTAGRPVRRGGGGWADLCALGAQAGAGRVVVVFPEGTRSRTGHLARFHTGAFRLAARADVPVVPVAIVGTRDLLPPDAKRTRAVPVEVRFGSPLDPGRPDVEVAARSAVEALLARGPAEAARARSHAVAAALATSRSGAVVAFVWGVAEALSWPLMAELFLALLVPAVGLRAWRLVPALTAGTVVGVVSHAVAARHGVALPAPLTTARMQAAASVQVAGHGAAAMFEQPFSGIPVKVYAAEAGRQGVPLPVLAATTAAARVGRMLLIGAGTAPLAHLLRRQLRSGYGVYLAALVAGFAVGLAVVVRSWS
ncbi:lysophospholipid acyltransferase family protein [Oryzihumus sp.]|uniref:lysophospholipid acyltransferase family protein n=1 Tax=Oryzihumus sp. TaxID=1968903 RepID=UPI002ED90664